MSAKLIWSKLFKRISTKSKKPNPRSDSECPPNEESDFCNSKSPPIDSVIPEPTCELELEPCPICKRTFVPATLEKHIGICQKMQTRKRIIFDSSQMRREGTELEKYLPPPPQMNTPAGLHKWLDSRVSPPKQQLTPLLNRRAGPTRNTSLSLGRQGRSNSSSSTGATGDYVRKRSISKEPVSEQCPYCERSFGMRAFDRHVDWCKEKAILKLHGAQTPKDSLGKDRLKARINYRAPSLRTKRGTTRDKYSPFDDVFMKNYVHNSKNKSQSEAARSTCNSMASSVISDGGFSDNYDPFKSAKRQLEELFSTGLADTDDTVSVTPTSKIATIKACDPIKTKHQTPPLDSNFRRSMSLRVPKKTTPSPMSNSKPSSVQSGITDDGPISTSFLKPEQFDEIPVRSVYSKVGLSLTGLDASLLRGVKDLNLSKTDSLAAFLSYEKHLGLSSEKDLKDSNNILNQATMQAVGETDSPTGSDTEEVEAKSPVKASLVVNELQKPYVKVIGRFEKTDRMQPGNQYIDPKLINDCDNLDTRSATVDECPLLPRLSHSGSDRKVQLKRQMKLQIDNILYDKTPVAGEGGECSVSPDSIVPAIGSRPATADQFFDDFDFEEFINSFEDDEKNPIFRDYKEMLQSQSQDSTPSEADKNESSQPTSFDFVSTDSSYGSLTRQSPETADGRPMLPKFCYGCGNEFLVQAKFCMECGAKRAILEE